MRNLRGPASMKPATATTIAASHPPPQPQPNAWRSNSWEAANSQTTPPTSKTFASKPKASKCPSQSSTKSNKILTKQSHLFDLEPTSENQLQRNIQLRDRQKEKARAHLNLQANSKIQSFCQGAQISNWVQRRICEASHCQEEIIRMPISRTAQKLRHEHTQWLNSFWDQPARYFRLFIEILLSQSSETLQGALPRSWIAKASSLWMSDYSLVTSSLSFIFLRRLRLSMKP